MPAVTVDDLTQLPRIPESQPHATVRPVVSMTTAPHGFEGEGFPVRRAFAGVDLRPARPVHPHGPDGRGGVRTGRAQGHAVAPAPRLRDRDLHARWNVRAPGQPRRRRHDHQRRHPVDDRRRWHPAHREAAGVAGPAGGLFHGMQLWVNLPRAQKWATRATRICAAAMSHSRPPRTPALWCGSSPARWADVTGPGSTYTP